MEYFLDSRTDQFKKDVYFNKGDIILDPFCGSGTTLVQANELGMHAIGIDISKFNSLISNVKTIKFDVTNVEIELNRITNSLSRYLLDSHVVEFDERLANELYKFNTKYFPSPNYRYEINNGLRDEHRYSGEKIKEFLPIYTGLIKQYRIKLKQSNNERFLDKWYLPPVREEIENVFEEIKKIKNYDTKKIISVILSRTIRSCRATTHSDLATLKMPINSVYYCSKHNKVCKPLFSIYRMWQRYTKDTLNRLIHFEKIRTDTYQICLTEDSRNVDLYEKLNKKNQILANLVEKQKIAGIFSSPPYAA